jgi:hypothetical protein
MVLIGKKGCNRTSFYTTPNERVYITGQAEVVGIAHETRFFPGGHLIRNEWLK